jgi:hypothetical protein
MIYLQLPLPSARHWAEGQTLVEALAPSTFLTIALWSIPGVLLVTVLKGWRDARFLNVAIVAVGAALALGLWVAFGVAGSGLPGG